MQLMQSHTMGRRHRRVQVEPAQQKAAVQVRCLNPNSASVIDNLDVQNAGASYPLSGDSMAMRTIDGVESLSAATTTADRWQLHDLFCADFPAGLPQYLDKVRHLHGRRNPHHQATHVEIDHGSWVHVE